MKLFSYTTFLENPELFRVIGTSSNIDRIYPKALLYFAQVISKKAFFILKLVYGLQFEDVQYDGELNYLYFQLVEVLEKIFLRREFKDLPLNFFDQYNELFDSPAERKQTWPKIEKIFLSWQTSFDQFLKELLIHPYPLPIDLKEHFAEVDAAIHQYHQSVPALFLPERKIQIIPLPFDAHWDNKKTAYVIDQAHEFKFTKQKGNSKKDLFSHLLMANGQWVLNSILCKKLKITENSLRSYVSQLNEDFQRQEVGKLLRIDPSGHGSYKLTFLG